MTDVNVAIPDQVRSMYEEMEGLLATFIDTRPAEFGAMVSRARLHEQSMELSIAAWLMEHIDAFAEHVRTAHAMPTDTPEDAEAAIYYGHGIVCAYVAGLSRVLAAHAMLDGAGVTPLRPAPAPPPAASPPPPTIGIDNAASFVPGPSTLQ